MRNTEPPGGGEMPILPIASFARSAGPEMSAGDSLVTQSSRDRVGRSGRLTVCGLSPSNRTTALPSLSTVVTTRRTLLLRGILCCSHSDLLLHERYYTASASISTKATWHGSSVRLLQAWLVPRWISTSPVLSRTSPSSISA